jgi:Uma2 family endonuclease
MAGSDPMAPTARPDRRLTYDDFLLFPDDGLRHEIIDGEHYVTPSPNLRHQDLVGRLFLALGNFLAAHPGAGRLFMAPLDVVFSFYDVVEPDLLFIARDQLEIMTEKNVQGAPALVVEVLSRSTKARDERIKLQLFDRSGVREYWLVDPDRNHVTAFRREDGGTLRSVASLGVSEHEVLTSPLLPGFSLSLADLFMPSI